MPPPAPASLTRGNPTRGSGTGQGAIRGNRSGSPAKPPAFRPGGRRAGLRLEVPPPRGTGEAGSGPWRAAAVTGPRGRREGRGSRCHGPGSPRRDSPASGIDVLPLLREDKQFRRRLAWISPQLGKGNLTAGRHGGGQILPRDPRTPLSLPFSAGARPLLGLAPWKCSKTVWMWYVGTWFSDEGDSVWLLLGVDGLRGLFDVSMPIAKPDAGLTCKTGLTRHGCPGTLLGARQAAASSHSWCS